MFSSQEKHWLDMTSSFQVRIYNLPREVGYLFQGPMVPFVVPCCKFLKSVILKTFNEIVLVFLSVESKTNILYVNTNFTGNLLLGFGRYCGKVLPEPAAFHIF